MNIVFFNKIDSISTETDQRQRWDLILNRELGQTSTGWKVKIPNMQNTIWAPKKYGFYLILFPKPFLVF